MTFHHAAPEPVISPANLPVRKPESGTTRERLEAIGRAGHIGGSTCEDCGNQAKKDCAFRRCRTCCRSRGFECPTHLKSTWVPASKRRERLNSEGETGGVSSSAVGIAGQSEKQQVMEEKASKRVRGSGVAVSHNSTSANSSDISSSQQDSSFVSGLPGQVRTHAMFRCVRVTPVNDGNKEFAYQAVVKIGGRVFKGFLYDQGSDVAGEMLEFSELQLSGRNVAVSSTSSFMEHVNVYSGVPGSGFIGSTSSYTARNSVN